MAETPSPTPAPGSEGTPKETPASPPAPLTAEEKLARLAAARAKNAAAAAAKAAGGAVAAPATPAPVVAPAVAAATPTAATPAAAAPAAPATAAEPAKPLTAEEKKARLEAVRAKNAAAAAAKAAGKPVESGVPATGAPASTPAAAHLAPTSAGAPQAATPAKPAAAAAKPVAAKAPGVPLPPPPQLTTRRTFVEWAFAAWVVFFAWLAGVGHMFLRFMFPNVLYESDPKFIAGKKSDFPESPKVYETFKTSQAVWVVRLTEEGQDRLVALSTVCTHLGCTPNWLEAEQKYKCPCHGSGYYLDGVNFEGPTPRPLERFRIYQDAAGNVVVDKAKKFRKDLSQWNENESYLSLA